MEGGLLNSTATLTAGDPDWLLPAGFIAAAAVLLTLFVNRHRLQLLSAAIACRIIALLILAWCLLNPLWSSARPRRGANVMTVLTDISQSHQVAIAKKRTRGDELAEALSRGEQSDPSGWLNRIDQDFELQRYTVSDRLQRVDSFAGVTFDQPASNVCSALEQLTQRFAGQPLAGIVLFSDGNATDKFADGHIPEAMPPVYAVLPPTTTTTADVAIDKVTVKQTAFDDAPVTIHVHTRQTKADNARVQVTLLDAHDVPVRTETRSATEQSPVRFEVRPDKPGTVFYTVRARLIDEDGSVISEEATDLNNQRLVAVDRGSRKRRVLYVSGRPNWEFKFLRRAVETDPLIELVGLIRIAKKEAKFDFRGREGESSNSLFRGFDETEQELAEEYDEPVLIRLGTRDEHELSAGFPEKAEDLFAYDAIILDDIEARFFLADQLQLIYEFVSRRGGGLLMLGGQESFRQGEYDRTPVGELLPVDLHTEARAPQGPLRMLLTRDGWLQPWVRLRNDEAAEEKRLAEMPGFLTLNAVDAIRPGAVELAQVVDSGGTKYPALVTQRFGRGRSAVLCLGDFWRWRMHEGRRRLNDFSLQARRADQRLTAPGETPAEDLNDHARACRQMVRWLVSETPLRLDVSVAPAPDLGLGTMRIQADLKSPDFQAQEDADVSFRVTRPDGTTVTVSAEPAEETIGRFEAVVAAVQPGPWSVLATAVVTSEERPSETLTTAVGWASQPQQEEMASVEVNESFLAELTKATGGRLLTLDDLNTLPEQLEQTDAPLVEVWSWPVWHQWWIFAVVVMCLVMDWTIRRRQGLP